MRKWLWGRGTYAQDSRYSEVSRAENTAILGPLSCLDRTLPIGVVCATGANGHWVFVFAPEQR